MEASDKTELQDKGASPDQYHMWGADCFWEAVEAQRMNIF